MSKNDQHPHFNFSTPSPHLSRHVHFWLKFHLDPIKRPRHAYKISLHHHPHPPNSKSIDYLRTTWHQKLLQLFKKHLGNGRVSSSKWNPLDRGGCLLLSFRCTRGTERKSSPEKFQVIRISARPFKRLNQRLGLVILLLHRNIRQWVPFMFTQLDWEMKSGRHRFCFRVISPARPKHILYPWLGWWAGERIISFNMKKKREKEKCLFT